MLHTTVIAVKRGSHGKYLGNEGLGFQLTTSTPAEVSAEKLRVRFIVPGCMP